MNTPFGAEDEARFIDNMRRLRESRDWSQGELARRVKGVGWDGFHQTTISRIEKGERPVRLGEAWGIAAALGTDLSAMVSPASDDAELTVLVELEGAVMALGQSASDLDAAVETFLVGRSWLLKCLEDARNAKMQGARLDRAIAAADALLKRSEEKHASVIKAEFRRVGAHVSDSDYILEPEL